MAPSDTGSTTPDQFIPHLTENIRFIEFSSDIVYLCHNEAYNAIKLSRSEVAIVRQFDGSRTLGDILQYELEHIGVIPFQTILELLNRLRRNDFLEEACARQLRLHPDEENASVGRLSRMAGWIGTVAYRFTLICKTGFSGWIADKITTPLFLVFWGLLAIANVFMHTETGGRNLLLGFSLSPVAPANVRYGSYTATFIILWLILSLYYSVKNYMSICRIASCNGGSIKAYVRFYYGLLILDYHPDAIVCIGFGGTIRLYIARIFFPFVIALLANLLHIVTDELPIVLLINKLFMIMGFMSLSPFFSSDLSRLLYFVVPQAGQLSKSNRFFMKRLLREIVDLRGKSSISDYYLFISLATIVWCYLFYYILWSVVKSTVVNVLADISGGPLWGQILLGTYILVVTVPVIAFLSIAGYSMLSNIYTAVRSPLRIIRRLADRIGHRPVPDSEQVREFLRNISLYARLTPEELSELCRHLTMMKIRKGETIIQQGEKGDAFYTIVSGSVQVVKEDISGDEYHVDTLVSGDSFGEIALLEAVPRTATVKSTAPTLLFKLEKKYFDKFIATSVERSEKITDLLRMTRHISKCPLFSFCSPAQIHAVVMRMERRNVEKGTIVFSQGDKGDCFYLIEEGNVILERTEENNIVWTKQLTKGVFFGEIALVRNIPRTATARAVSSVRLLTLSRNDFYEVMGTSLLGGAAIDSVVKRRLAELGREVSCAL